MSRLRVALAVLTVCCVSQIACTRDGCDTAIDPVGWSSFFVLNGLDAEARIEVLGDVCATSGLTAKSIKPSGSVPPSGKLYLGRCAAFSPPLPSEVFQSIVAQSDSLASGDPVAVYERADEASDVRCWQKVVKKADYPQEYEYTLALSGGSAAAPGRCW